MSNPTDRPPLDLPPGLLRDLVETLARYGHTVPAEEVLPAMITMLHGGERRSSTRLIFGRLIATYGRPLTAFTRGEQFAYVDALAIVTGRGHSGIRAEAEAAAASGSW